MLTLVKDASAVELVGIHRNSNRSRKPEATVYFTHDAHPEKANIARGFVLSKEGAPSSHVDLSFLMSAFESLYFLMNAIQSSRRSNLSGRSGKIHGLHFR